MTNVNRTPDPESIVDDYLASLDPHVEPDIEALCGRYPALAAELRLLVSDHLRARAELERGSVFGPGGATRRPDAVPGAARAGDVLGDFRLIRPLGTGGMGQVWEAEQGSLARRVALKLVRPERVSTRTLDLFAREARAGGRLSHPGIVAVYGHGEENGVAWIAMELVEGGWTLRDAIDELDSAVELPRSYYDHVARFVAALADALGEAHAAGVIHRDLKPLNVLVTANDEPKLTDFGLARITDETALSVSGDIAGTYLYMSPEQLAAKRAGIDHRTDVFSLGIVLYEMLTLQRPFQGDTSHQVAAQILMKDPPSARSIRSKVPEDLAVICGKCLEKDRSQRYDNMSDVAAELRRHLENEPILAKPPTAVQRGVKWAKRNPTKSVAAGLVAVALTVISVLAVKNATLAEERNEQAQLAREQAATAEAERSDVLRLSAQQDLEDLLLEQAELWPPHPELLPAYRGWLDRAEALVAELPQHEAKRAELRARALPWSEEQRLADREAHPDFGRLAPLLAKLESKERALAVRRGESEPEIPWLDTSELPREVGQWNALAWALVGPGREAFGQEARGLTIALEALGRVRGAERPLLLRTIANAWFSLGVYDRALDANRSAQELTPPGASEAFLLTLSEMDVQIREAWSDQGVTAAEAELSSLYDEVAALEARLEERLEWSFPADEDEVRWWNASLTRLIEGLEKLERYHMSADVITAAHGWSVGKRMSFAEQLEKGFASGGKYDRAWQRDLAAIREAYPGLDLEPQMGLVPIGPDPMSGLWEFAHLASGEPPSRVGDGELELVEETCVVLVLIPTGVFWMGAQNGDRNRRNYDPNAVENETPVHEVSLSAYFLSKYECTQAQWRRITGHSPSNYTPDNWGVEWSRGRLTSSFLQPVEQVSWLDCVNFLPRVGLGLPSEAQWENGARGGTSTVFWSGDSVKDLGTVANIKDQYALVHGGEVWRGHESFDDGNTVHGRVGSYRANPFGLHEVHGNLFEWCQDGHDQDYYSEGVGTDPVCTSVVSGRVLRGGSFSSDAIGARSAYRRASSEIYADNHVGVRPARPVVN